MNIGLETNVNINDDYKTKFQYTNSQIKFYNLVYTRKNIAINLNDNETEMIKKVWKMKLDERNASWYRDDMYVDKHDPPHVKMSYTKNQIRLYCLLYGWNDNDIGYYAGDARYPEATYEWIKKGVQSEWEYMVQNNNYHSRFYQRQRWTSNLYSLPIWQRYMEDQSISETFHAEFHDETPTIDGSGASHYMSADQFWDKWDEAKNANLLAIQRFASYSINDTEFNKIEYTIQERGLHQLALTEYETNDAVELGGGTPYEIPNRTGSVNGDKNQTDPDTIIDSGTQFINSGNQKKIDEDNLKALSNSIYNILLGAGVIIAIIIGAIIAIKFMAGSVEEKADVKKLLIPYVVGCIVVFGAFGIWKLAVTIFAEM